jgi:hypothetical protein
LIQVIVERDGCFDRALTRFKPSARRTRKAPAARKKARRREWKSD